MHNRFDMYTDLIDKSMPSFEERNSNEIMIVLKKKILICSQPIKTNFDKKFK